MCVLLFDMKPQRFLVNWRGKKKFCTQKSD